MSKCLFTWFLCLLLPTSVFAIPPGQWQCIAFDAKERNFPAVGPSMKRAQQIAIELCRIESSQPKTCRSAQSFCEQGPLRLNSDTCLVTDETGRTWSADGADACKTAMYMCNQWQYLHGTPRGQCTVKYDGPE